MNKALLHDWSGGQLLEGTGYTHEQDIDGNENIMTALETLWKAGLDIMLMQPREQERFEQYDVILLVDNGRFRQR